MTKISVVIPMYNSSEGIEETLRSVAEQTYPRELIDVIIVDDK